HRMALAVSEGAESVPDSTVQLRRIAELEDARKALSAQDTFVRAQQAQANIPVVTHDADGIAWGTPTRYGNMSAQMKQFVDTTGGLWLKGELEDKATGIFTSTATIHGGQETTILTALVPLIHLGMIFVGTPYGQAPWRLYDLGPLYDLRPRHLDPSRSANMASCWSIRRSIRTRFKNKGDLVIAVEGDKKQA